MGRTLLRLALVSLGMMAVMTVLTGVVYPLALVGANQALFPDKADGSLIRLDGQVVGSALVGQEFTSPAYFHSRPSGTGYSALPTSFANLGPNQLALKEAVNGRIRDALALERPYTPGLTARDLPVDMVTTSGSGIDPEISEANARLQARRVAAVRGVALAKVLDLVDRRTRGRFAAFLGEPGVNVLRLNLDLDQITGAPRR